MKKRFAIVSTFILVLLVSLIVGSVFVQAQTQALPGVSAGDTFTYQNTIIWNSTNPVDVTPAYLIPENQSTLQITIKLVTGSTVQYQQLLTYQNGTQQNSTDLSEVNTGLTGSVLVYAANLTAGELLFPGSSTLPYTINDTTIRTYANNFRNTNHILVNNTGAEGSGIAYSIMNLYFDQQTGICVEYYLTTVYTDNPNQALTQHLVLESSNVWTVSNVPVTTPTVNPSSSSTANPTSSAATSPETTSTESTTGTPMDLIYTIVIAVVVALVIVALLFVVKGRKQPNPPVVDETLPSSG